MEVTYFKKSLQVGLKLAITLRHLAKGETYKSLNYHWLVVQTIIYKFALIVCCSILDEFQEEYLTCPTTPKSEEKFRSKWIVPHVLGALDGKHIAMKMPKKSESEFYNYKVFFSLVLLVLVDRDYRFLWVNLGSSGSSSDAHLFNHSKLNDGTLGFLPH